MLDRSSRNLTLFLLTGVYSINYVDRQVLAILVEPIKADLALSDTKVGLLLGAPFAVLYATMSIPIASYADRANRAKLITGALAIFSAMSAACGLAVVYWQLLAARSGLAIFEAGTNAPSHSLISDFVSVQATQHGDGGVFVGSAYRCDAVLFDRRVGCTILGLAHGVPGDRRARPIICRLHHSCGSETIALSNPP